MAARDHSAPPSASRGERRSLWRVLWRIAVLIGLGLLAGLVAGFVAGGMGSRVAMRVVALVAGREHYGEVTDADAIVGRITADGTGFLLFFGTFLGVPGGLLYVAVRRWVPGSGIRKGLAFGGLLLLLFGSLVIEGGNLDFRRFVPSYLSVGLFASLFFLYGLIASAIVERLDRGGGSPPRGRILALGGYAALVLAGLFGLARDVRALAEIF
ncbi:MAG: hypothetical protein QOJ59_3651 [Thermomicrobiales bacterium]|jgi:hypothetical protein|nr:hypothetical protein [Thermomicrobiales bacterium]